MGDAALEMGMETVANLGNIRLDSLPPVGVTSHECDANSLDKNEGYSDTAHFFNGMDFNGMDADMTGSLSLHAALYPIATLLVTSCCDLPSGHRGEKMDLDFDGVALPSGVRNGGSKLLSRRSKCAHNAVVIGDDTAENATTSKRRRSVRRCAADSDIYNADMDNAEMNNADTEAQEMN